MRGTVGNPILATAVLLSACATVSGGRGNATTYQCADGSVIEARYPAPGTARIVRNGRSIEMTIAVSASGARYVGGGWQWWTKGMAEATLSPLAPGEAVASASGTSCTAW